MITAIRVARAMTAATLTLGFGVATAANPVGDIARINGVAIVSQGAQYVKAHEGMPLYPGNRFMVMDGGSAVVAFTDGCHHSVGDNEILTIGATSTCASEGAGVDKVKPYEAISHVPDASQLVQKAAMGGPPTPPPEAVAAAAEPGFAWWAPLAAFAVVGGTVAVVHNNNNDNHNYYPPPISR
jgi:hypothetical protein